MDKKEILESISNKGNGEIYLGVVGAVRTGKSTFIKKVIETLVIPNVVDESEKKRCLDEIPQTSGGKQIMSLSLSLQAGLILKLKRWLLTLN